MLLSCVLGLPDDSQAIHTAHGKHAASHLLKLKLILPSRDRYCLNRDRHQQLFQATGSLLTCQKDRLASISGTNSIKLLPEVFLQE